MSKKFIEIITTYPAICTYPEYEGKPYYSIRYEENGEIFEGFGTYKPEVLSGYISEYFIGAKKGKWIKIPEFCGDDVSGFIDNHFSCSECKKEAEINSWGFYILSAFCPHCGADMRGEENDG